MNNFDVLLGMKLGGGGGSSTLVEKTITANGTYNPADDNADGYSSVTANVPNTYTVADEGKVVDSGALVGQTAKSIDANGLYDTTLNNSVSVDVPNSYTAGDEGKVVSGGTLVSQTAYPSTIVTNGTYDTTLNNSVTVDVGATPTLPEKDVNFYDCDGSVLYAYTTQEFLALTEMPANPTRTGLVSQGWNWSLAEAQDWVTTYGKLDIGQNYVTDDGKTRLYIHCSTPMTVKFEVNLNYDFDVDWGDGSSILHITGNSTEYFWGAHTHDYLTDGDYVITITYNVESRTGRFRVQPSGIVTKVETGATRYIPVCFYPNAEYISLPNTAYTTRSTTIQLQHVPIIIFGAKPTSDNYTQCEITNVEHICFPHTTHIIGAYNSPWAYGDSGGNVRKLTYCPATISIARNMWNLRYVAIDPTITSIGQYAFSGCASLTSIDIPSGVTSIGQYAFSGCNSLTSIDIPSGVRDIGQYAFQNCTSLTSIDIPSGVTTIGNGVFYQCRSFTSITIPSGVRGDIGNNAFYACTSLTSINIPSGVTSIGNSAIYGCTSLSSVTIPSTVTSIGTYCFTNCTSLTSIDIPSGVTSIGEGAFSGCTSLSSVKFEPTTPPTVANANVFGSLPTTCTIYVPTGSLTAYTTANNYPDPNIYTYVEY